MAYRGLENWPKGGPVQSESSPFDGSVLKGTVLYPVSFRPVDAGFIIDESVVVGVSNPLSNIIPKNYFELPAKGLNWGELHNYNAVDIANTCGTVVYASAEGLVVSDEVLGEGSEGWNNGYGIFVLVEHPNGTKTRYAHLGRVLVEVGDYISQGQEVGLMGDTGASHGPSGCHLHFEVYGAKNPFAIK